MNHPQLSLTIPEEQQHCLQYLQNLLIEEFEDIKNGYKIILKFEPSNPYFENDTLVKEYRLEKGSRKRKASESSFFSWFTDSNHSNLDEIADVSRST